VDDEVPIPNSPWELSPQVYTAPVELQDPPWHPVAMATLELPPPAIEVAVRGGVANKVWTGVELEVEVPLPS
jgi:hypothetical protein